jgi:hypothetical protein
MSKTINQKQPAGGEAAPPPGAGYYRSKGGFTSSSEKDAEADLFGRFLCTSGLGKCAGGVMLWQWAILAVDNAHS